MTENRKYLKTAKKNYAKEIYMNFDLIVNVSSA